MKFKTSLVKLRFRTTYYLDQVIKLYATNVYKIKKLFLSSSNI